MFKIKFIVLIQLIGLLLSNPISAQILKGQYEIAAFPDLNTVPAPEKPTGPEWINTAVFYEIYPQTYCDTNGDGIGDLKGIIAKLDYIKSLGVDAIWLNPFYVSPFRDAGYDIADYYHVAPRYGSDQDARNLFRIAKQKGMRIIIDFVPGHTSIDHPWFKASCSRLPNKYSNWYIWTNGTWFNGMEKFKDNFIQGYCERDGNYMTNFFWHQPALNYGWGNPDPEQPWQLSTDHPDVLALKAEMKKVMKYWLDMGCSGFRVDMAGSLVKNDANQSIRFFWQDIRKMLNTQYPDAFIVSEWSLPKEAIHAGFHADFMHWFEGYDDLFFRENSFFRSSGQGNISHFLDVYFQQYASTKGKGYISLPVGNHDLTRINNGGRDQRDLEIIQVFAFTMPNVPFIYYGDEIGMRQLDHKIAKEGAYAQRSGDRTPMQWNTSKNLGFSTAPFQKIYLPYDTSKSAPTVSTQEKDPASLLSFMRKLVKLHKSESALSNFAAFVPVYARKDKYPFVFLRVFGSEKLLVALNPSDKPAVAYVKGEIEGNRKLIMGADSEWVVNDGNTQIKLSAKAFSIIKIN